MKKVLSIVFVAGFLAVVACGPSAEEKAAQEQAMKDSVAQAEQAQKAMQDQAAMQDSTNKMEAAPADTAKK